MASTYLQHRILAAPRAWKRVADWLVDAEDRLFAAHGDRLYGIWRAQIGRPRDELTAISVWPDAARAAGTVSSAHPTSNGAFIQPIPVPSD